MSRGSRDSLRSAGSAITAMMIMMIVCSGWMPAVSANVFDNATETSGPDLIALVLNRDTVYSNDMHNGLILHAQELGIHMEIWDTGNFWPDRSRMMLQRAIDLPTEQQPKAYAVWPIDDEARGQMRELHEKHGAALIQVNQLPSDEEWPYLIGYAGPDDALRAKNAAVMIIEALEEKYGMDDEDHQLNVIGLGYPDTYAGYHLSINAFAERLMKENSTTLNLDLSRRLPLDWGAQPPYDAVLELLEEYAMVSGARANPDTDEFDSDGRQIKDKPILHALYCMDDRILNGAYQALVDLGVVPGVDIILVGTVCNGARSLLEDGSQYGTTAQSPFLEGKLIVEMTDQYINGGLAERTQFTPNPIVTGDTWVDNLVDFLGRKATVDQLCSWELEYDKVAGPLSVDSTNSICEIITCEFIPEALFSVGYALVSVNYFLAVGSAILLYIYRKMDIVRIAQPFFLMIVIIGSVLDTTSIVFMSRDNRNYTDQELDQACIIWPVMLSVGHMMTTATLAAKISRVKRLVDAGLTFRRVQVSVFEVSLFIVFFVSLDIIVLAVWFSTDPFQWTLHSTSKDSQGYVTDAVGECRSDGQNYFVYPLVIVFLHLSVLVYANYLAYKTAPYHEISDAKSIAICLFNSIQLVLIGTPIVALVGDNTETSYLIRVCIVFLNNFGVLVIIVAPKLYKCLVGEGDDRPSVSGVIAAQKKQKSTYSSAEGPPRSGGSGHSNNPTYSTQYQSEGGLRDSARAAVLGIGPFGGKSMESLPPESVPPSEDFVAADAPVSEFSDKKAEGEPLSTFQEEDDSQPGSNFEPEFEASNEPEAQHEPEPAPEPAPQPQPEPEPEPEAEPEGNDKQD
eukprot:CAMPEP_0168761992 /NCGR_PEP_ID=MMETSP0724-20121128/23609_1 /TAXON_ID=265536 /ORGANISM="Amphiprora sp., Strain CCMP467" /LENGTH=849 /DNA_ID=CAMNT_0008811133 /DNA_START=137 /DNA_END=2686 /DNA_ORIENTATION=+